MKKLIVLVVVASSTAFAGYQLGARHAIKVEQASIAASQVDTSTDPDEVCINHQCESEQE